MRIPTRQIAISSAGAVVCYISVSFASALASRLFSNTALVIHVLVGELYYAPVLRGGRTAPVVSGVRPNKVCAEQIRTGYRIAGRGEQLSTINVLT